MSVDLKQTVHELEQVDVLEELPESDLVELAKDVTVREFGAKEAIYSPGEPNGHILIVAEGKAKVHKVSNSGREFVLNILQPGDTFGIIHDNGDERNEVYVTAVEAGRLYALPRERFHELMARSPEVSLRVIAKLNDRLRRAEEQIEDFAFRNVPTRLARLLARLGEDYGTVGRQGITIGLRLSHQDIANMLATSRETVSGVLGDLREAGLIRTGGRMISILNYQGLEEAGNPN
ncbi:MAG: Crp/Fnr family transcriptional regulator [Armatimonadota bacterium]